MTANLALREDLLQEALIHLWLTESRRPNQTKSWYLQSCKYHLLHYLASGRSIDSGKRRASQMVNGQDWDDRDGFPEEIDSGNSVLTWVSARDIISLLSPQLLPHERAVLDCFADGLGPREIGRKLKMSHTMVIKHRRKIASLFSRLDLPQPRLGRCTGFRPQFFEEKLHLNGNRQTLTSISEAQRLESRAMSSRTLKRMVLTNGHSKGRNGH